MTPARDAKITALILLSTLGLSACSNKVSFQAMPESSLAGGPAPLAPLHPVPLPAASPAPGSSCSSGQVQTTTENVKIIFMVDNSGSTQGGYDYNDNFVPGTDPNYLVRVSTIQNFIQKYGAKTNLQFGFGYFGDSAYLATPSDLIQNGQRSTDFLDVADYSNLYDVVMYGAVGTPIYARFPLGAYGGDVFGSGSFLSSALNKFRASADASNQSTEYGLGLGAVAHQISADQTANPGWKYVLVFMSDGQPSDMNGNQSVPEQLSAIVQKMRSDVQSHGSDLTVSTVLFDFPSHSSYGDSVQNLRTMASVGGGQFIDTTAARAGSIQIEDIISVPVTCP